METFIFALNAVMPIVILIALGYFLKRIKLLDEPFLNVGNKFVFKVLLPILLFYNVYQIDALGTINWTFVGYCIAATIIIAIAAVIFFRIYTKDNRKRGSMIQATFRSNYAIIGLPLATSLYGELGAAAASVLSAFTIPLYNIMAVIVLSVYGNKKDKLDIKKVLIGIITNPLVIAVTAGMLILGVRDIFVHCDISFRLTDITLLYSAIKSIAGCATPLALVILGGRFEFSASKKLLRPIILGTVIRTVVVPCVALIPAVLFVKGLGGEHYASYIAAFCTPAAVASAIMAKEMDCDDELAGQLVVWTSVVSVFTIFGIVAIFRSVGIF